MVSRHEKNTESLEEDGLRCLLGQILQDIIGRLLMNQNTQIGSSQILYPAKTHTETYTIYSDTFSSSRQRVSHVSRNSRGG